MWLSLTPMSSHNHRAPLKFCNDRTFSLSYHLYHMKLTISVHVIYVKLSITWTLQTIFRHHINVIKNDSTGLYCGLYRVTLIVCWRLKKGIHRAHREPASATVKEISHYKSCFSRTDGWTSAAALNNQYKKRREEDERRRMKGWERGGDGGGCFVTAGDRGEEEEERLKGPKKLDFCRHL